MSRENILAGPLAKFWDGLPVPSGDHMRALIIFFLIVFPGFASAAFAWENYTGKTMIAYVRAVEKGNTLVVNESNRDDSDNFPLRFYGIGIPTARQPFGREAHAALTGWLPKGQKLIITTVNQDEEGVYSALVQVNDHSVNNRLVDEGLAWVDRSTCKAFFCRRWHIQENLAIKARRGLWSLNIHTPPWQWGEVKN